MLRSNDGKLTTFFPYQMRCQMQLCAQNKAQLKAIKIFCHKLKYNVFARLPNGLDQLSRSSLGLEGTIVQESNFLKIINEREISQEQWYSE